MAKPAAQAVAPRHGHIWLPRQKRLMPDAVDLARRAKVVAHATGGVGVDLPLPEHAKALSGGHDGTLAPCCTASRSPP